MDKFVIRYTTTPPARMPLSNTAIASHRSSASSSEALLQVASQITMAATHPDDPVSANHIPPPEQEPSTESSAVLCSKTKQLVDRPDDLGTDRPCQPKLKMYPITKFGDKNRSFGGTAWYSQFLWLEYSIKQDKCFCYPCQKYTPCHNNPSDRVFSMYGFSNWKIAMEKGKGFLRHNIAQSHMVAMQKWKEHSIRTTQGTEINQLLSPLQIEKNRYYLQSIFDVIRFLAVNELAFRGSSENEESTYSTGKFLSLLSYTVEKDDKLKEIAKTIPDYAKYTSPEMQNMIIEDMAAIVKQKIVNMLKSSDCNMFTLKCDGTRDKNNVENLSVVVRFVFQGKLHEHLLEISELGHDELDAKSIANQVMTIIETDDIDPSSMISQCFDGASVMSGVRSGVQKRLQDRIGEEIPFVHCFNHQLHLVITNALKRVAFVRRMFEVCDGLYNFTRRPLIAQHYDGEKLKRLLQQRWSGHLSTISTIRKCYHELLDLLDAIGSHPRASGLDVAEAIGYSHQMKSALFLVSLATVEKILLTCQPVNAMLQSKSASLIMAIPLLENCTTQIKKMRDESSDSSAFDGIWSNCQVFIEEPQPKRIRRENTAFVDNIVDCPLPIHSNQPSNTKEELRKSFLSIVDEVLSEFASRFNERSMKYVESMLCLDDTENEANFLNIECLTPFAMLLQRRLDMDHLKNEIPVVKSFINEKLHPKEKGNCMTAHHIHESLYEYRDAFPQTYKLFTGALTFGTSTATCENSFSTLTRILSPSRRSMTQTRMKDLVMLAFEREITSTISKEEMLTKFREKNRRFVV
jgi:hypothetical protein